MPREVTKDQQLCEKLTVLCSAPGTLKTLARYAVRHSLGLQYLPDAVKALPLPASLKDYLLLLDSCCLYRLVIVIGETTPI